MLSQLINISILTSTFSIIDLLLSRYTQLEGIYYLLHSIHNAGIVYLTGSEVINSLTSFNYIQNGTKNLLALQCVVALHIYHILVYFKKLRFDDWLHHILMIGVALPIGGYVDSKSLLGYSLFFTTGLPGGIDYFLLFLVRNNLFNRNHEKSINAWLNTWIRSPGCISHATLTILLTSTNFESLSFIWFCGILVATLTYWNGQYFMRQVVENNALVSEKRLP